MAAVGYEEGDAGCMIIKLNTNWTDRKKKSFSSFSSLQETRL